MVAEPAGPAVTTGSADPAGSASASAKPRTALWKSLLKAAIAALFIGGVVYSVVRQWGEVRPLLGQLSLSALGVATVSVFVGVYATFMAWRAIMADPDADAAGPGVQDSGTRVRCRRPGVPADGDRQRAGGRGADAAAVRRQGLGYVLVDRPDPGRRRGGGAAAGAEPADRARPAPNPP